MGLMQQAYDTYCAMESQYAGIYGKAKEPLVPVSHQIVNAELELTLDADGICWTPAPSRRSRPPRSSL